MRQVTVHVAHEELEYAPLVVPMNHVIDILKIAEEDDEIANGISPCRCKAGGAPVASFHRAHMLVHAGHVGAVGGAHVRLVPMAEQYHQINARLCAHGSGNSSQVS